MAWSARVSITSDSNRKRLRMSTQVWVTSIREASSRVNCSSSVAVFSTWWARMVSLKMEAVSARGMGVPVRQKGRPAMQRLCQA